MKPSEVKDPSPDFRRSLITHVVNDKTLYEKSNKMVFLFQT